MCFRSLRLSPPETSHGVPGLVKLSTNQVVGDLNLTVRSSSSKFLAIFKIVIQSNWNLLDSGTWWPVDYFVDGFASFCHLNCVLHLVSLKKLYHAATITGRGHPVISWFITPNVFFTCIKQIINLSGPIHQTIQHLTKKAPETEAPKRPCPEVSDDPNPQRVQRCHRVALPRTAAVCQGRAMVCQLRFVPVDCAATDFLEEICWYVWKFADSDNESRYIKVINSNFCLFRNGGFTRESPFKNVETPAHDATGCLGTPGS